MTSIGESGEGAYGKTVRTFFDIYLSGATEELGIGIRGRPRQHVLEAVEGVLHFTVCSRGKLEGLALFLYGDDNFVGAQHDGGVQDGLRTGLGARLPDGVDNGEAVVADMLLARQERNGADDDMLLIAVHHHPLYPLLGPE